MKLLRHGPRGQERPGVLDADGRVRDLSAIVPDSGVALFRLPRLDHVGVSFDVNLLAPFIVASLAATLRVMGDISNAQRLNDSDWVRPSFTSLAGGVSANGIAMIFCGLVGSFGINSYSSSIGLSGACVASLGKSSGSNPL